MTVVTTHLANELHQLYFSYKSRTILKVIAQHTNESSVCTFYYQQPCRGGKNQAADVRLQAVHTYLIVSRDIPQSVSQSLLVVVTFTQSTLHWAYNMTSNDNDDCVASHELFSREYRPACNT